MSIGLHSDPFLDHFSRAQCIKVLSTSTHSIREDRFSAWHAYKPIKSKSVRASLDSGAQTFPLANWADPASLDGGAQTFRLADWADPRLDGDKRIAFLLQTKLTGYSTSDDPAKPQVTMTASILRMFFCPALSSFEKAIYKLFIRAFFFAMGYCEYIQVSSPWKTKLLALKNVNFYKGRRQLNHQDQRLHLADCVSITFEMQKKDSKNDIITQHCSSGTLLCPVKIWSKIIHRLISYLKKTRNNGQHLSTWQLWST